MLGKAPITPDLPETPEVLVTEVIGTAVMCLLCDVYQQPTWDAVYKDATELPQLKDIFAYENGIPCAKVMNYFFASLPPKKLLPILRPFAKWFCQSSYYERQLYVPNDYLMAKMRAKYAGEHDSLHLFKVCTYFGGLIFSLPQQQPDNEPVSLADVVALSNCFDLKEVALKLAVPEGTDLTSIQETIEQNQIQVEFQDTGDNLCLLLAALTSKALSGNRNLPELYKRCMTTLNRIDMGHAFSARNGCPPEVRANAVRNFSGSLMDLFDVIGDSKR